MAELEAKSSAFLLVTGPRVSSSSDLFSDSDKISDNFRKLSVNPDQFHSLEDVRSAIKKQGLETCNIIFAIDYTISNVTNGSKTFCGKSLHDLSGVNPYQKMITAIGETIDPMRGEIEYIHAFGFGDNEVKDKRVFPLSQEPCSSFYDILGAYNTKTKEVKFGGPTSFVPVIAEAIRIVKETGKYHILIIVADGQVNEEHSSLKAIIEASDYALSIVVIGVGDGPWGVMEEWDDLENFNNKVAARGLSTRRFDNVQFVNYHEITHEAKNPDVALALATLMEIPDQYKFIKENILVNV
ncbi:uncharacterized protein LOC127851847 [Dreissena polymorpha]|uniref:VWFA domain-containing protein n=1 Tax=Dreissena polymorpha TaxID=45954 RepID=A0A9D4I2K0_DREPO|nr:uncharacterized protein LOC127851847 [Dreissena polymorpha]KAH3741878.1 hypothetical protein DPMN_048608 [Dreissena polymorpha]